MQKLVAVAVTLTVPIVLSAIVCMVPVMIYCGKNN